MATGAIKKRAKLQSNRYHQQTNTQLFTGRMPFLSPNQQCQSTEGNSLVWNTMSIKILTCLFSVGAKERCFCR